MRNRVRLWISEYWICILLHPAVFAGDSTEKLEYFERHVRPVLANRCYNCHSADNKAAGGLRLDDGHGLLSGGGRGPALIPGDPSSSLLRRFWD
ncbi:MAG: c-type cytochrome domain-containing protein [Planctomycetota bacterium]